MNLVVCPHCKSHRIVTARVPKDVIVVMTCPACGELVVLYRKKVIAVDRHTLEAGTRDEKKEHIAEVITEFIESGVLGFGGRKPANQSESSGKESADQGERDSNDDSAADELLPPISDREVAEFTRVQLERLDNADYFRRHFG